MDMDLFFFLHLHPRQNSVEEEADDNTVLQLHSTSVRRSRSSTPTLSLQDLLPTDPVSAVRVKSVEAIDLPLPSWISLDKAATLETVSHELQAYGHHGQTWLNTFGTFALCAPATWHLDENLILLPLHGMLPQRNYVWRNLSSLQPPNNALDEVAFMRILHSYGIEKAVIQQKTLLQHNIIEVCYIEAAGHHEHKYPTCKIAVYVASSPALFS